ncbi:MAG: hypothetical protein KDK91_33315 [Gammaproteobacteria bacterium]|nr:hypothetical protein [Gammaproteobacteria bacterium]
MPCQNRRPAEPAPTPHLFRWPAPSRDALGCWLLLAVLACTCGSASAASIDAFYGIFEGETIIDELDEGDQHEGTELRDLRVEIRPVKAGFEVIWQSLSRWESGRVKRRSFQIEFARHTSPGLYVAQMKKDLFGNLRPADPIGEQPYVWAYLHGDVLSVSAFRVLDTGGYEVSIYDRQLVPGGLRLAYRRFEGPRLVKSLNAMLTRVPTR